MEEINSKIEHFKGHELIIRAPGRINLIGEHTDYNGGLCLPAAISQSIYLGISRSEDLIITAIDRRESSDLSTLNHNWVVYVKGVVDLLSKEFGTLPPFKMDFGGDLPSGAGLSSSSAITCGLVRALNELFSLGIPIEEETRYAVLAERASGLQGGMMDQITIMNGRSNHALLIDCSDWSFNYVPVELKEYVWLIIDTKVVHTLVDSDYNNRSAACRSIKDKLKIKGLISAHISELISPFNTVHSDLTEQENIFLKYVLEENERVQKFASCLKRNLLIELGSILLEGHKGLREEYKVSCEELDFLVNFAEYNDHCLGARMMGGGFGGSTIHLLPQEHLENYRIQISNAYEKKYGFSPEIFVASITDGVRRIE